MNSTITWAVFGGHDLIAKYMCSCGETHTLWGYNDAYFWDVVNQYPTKTHLPCGAVKDIQWHRGGGVTVSDISEEDSNV